MTNGFADDSFPYSVFARATALCEFLNEIRDDLWKLRVRSVTGSLINIMQC